MARHTLTVLGVVPPRRTGVSYVRFFLPFEHLASRGIAFRHLGHDLTFERGPTGLRPSATILEGVDVVMLPQLVLGLATPQGERIDLVGHLVAMARERGIPVLYSVDDHVAAAAATNPLVDSVESVESAMRRMVESADGIVATTRELANALDAGDRPAWILPNAVDPARWKRRRNAGGLPRLGWAGSASHLDDLLAWAPVLGELRRRGVSFEFTLYGLTDLEWEQQRDEARRGARQLSGDALQRARAFLELATRLDGLDVRHRPFDSVDGFVDTLPGLDWDIGVCPLVDRPFNRCKSAIKFYEYAACGTLTVASDIPPYRDEVSLTAPDDVDVWAETLESLLADPDRRGAETEAQRDWVLEQRDIRSVAPAWEAMLHDAVALKGCGARARRSP